MRFLWTGFAVLLILCGLAFRLFAHQAPVAAQGTDHPVPVLVELFTSEGCSSCPPADALLAKLDSAQFVPGARAIVLSEHVTYWNSLGWRDPFSFEKMTDRQQAYASRLRLDGPYTPQAVVDGAAEFVGSDERKLARAVSQAAATPKVSLTIERADSVGRYVHFAIRGELGSGLTLTAALADDTVQSSVVRGENGGRTLRHVAVVRVMDELGAGAVDGRELSLKQPSGDASTLRLVVFATDRRTGHVLAVDERVVGK